ncbi:hypothetical protein WG904_12685 [Pedobacter sp. Du54]|uniref:hypothetical protein n=1 Tax=Pedobacter anseongensis TaxID=3133439 RepID=UPI0030ADC8DC
MKAILNRQKLKRMDKPPPVIHVYQTWEREVNLIQIQLAQLRAIFERGSFVLSKRDFERLGALERSQKELQKKINPLIQNLGTNQMSIHCAKHKVLKNIANEIEQGLILLYSSLANLKKEKFTHTNKTTTCL